ncbi:MULTISPECIES: ABC transporter permease [Oligella]|uniref:ABC transporter permease n=1 Tax=Oligella urethralis DNF00040 TaxID=1401065 RepID=A0A096BDN7_9BURK|nr:MULTISPECIES: ABC transporter permease [Oligella]AVL71285.1 ABC transporter permease [Oligella urethralis]KGF31259.1 ABC transporter permease [Oligella urethralis DNF00040]MDK6202796.1 ABC transporter permease [Oligella urethralis]OFS87730.1 ABC transporter permease [Oligella sp. HMSC05A10]OFV47697.1 ABC transporter permease [Oligella sp. HMSC09E12]
MSLLASLGALELGLIYSLVALGVFISFRILRFPDLTVDGTFATGGAVAALMISQGYEPFMVSLCAALAGAVAGSITGWLNTKLGIMDLLASILMMTALYSINLRIMSGPNIPLIFDETVFTSTVPAAISDYLWRPILLTLILISVLLLLNLYFSTRSGLAMRATGANLRMARSQGVATDRSIIGGMALSNAMVALAGALFAQSQGGSDISMGIGTIVIGLAAVILGQSVIHARRFLFVLLSVIFGAIVYRFFIAFALNSDVIGLKAQDLNLVTALLVTIALILPKLKKLLLKK